MKKLILLILSIYVFAAEPSHDWSGVLKVCANRALNKNSDHNLTKEELESIKKFECNYNGEFYIEPIRDLVNIEILKLRGSRLVSDVITHIDESNETLIVIDDKDTLSSAIWIDKLNRVFFDVNQSVEYDFNTTHSLPGWIGDFTNLKELDLSGSGLVGSIPDEIGNLSSLEKLDLSVNEFTKLPAAIGNLSSLKELHLASCGLVQQLPPELGNLSSLEKLYLQDNKFFGEIPPELGDLLFLKKLRLNQNNLKGNIPVDLADLDLTQPNGLGLHENCNLKTDENLTIDWIESKASLYRGYDGVRHTGGNCWTSAMVPIIMYLLD